MEKEGSSKELVVGKLDRVILNKLSFELKKEGGFNGKVNIETKFEVGVKPERDAYYVAITVDIKAITPEEAQEKAQELYNASGKMTAFYSLPGPFDGTDDKLANAAIARASLQAYPLLRLQILEVLRKGGVGIKEFKFEPDFIHASPKDVSLPQESGKPARASKPKGGQGKAGSKAKGKTRV